MLNEPLQQTFFFHMYLFLISCFVFLSYNEQIRSMEKHINISAPIASHPAESKAIQEINKKPAYSTFELIVISIILMITALGTSLIP